MRPSRAVGILRADIDAEMAVQRRQHVLRRLGIRARKSAARIRGADDPAAEHRTAGERRAEYIRIMIAPRIVVDAWGAAELTPGDDQRRFQKAALLKVLNEGRVRLIEARQEAAPQ